MGYSSGGGYYTQTSNTDNINSIPTNTIPISSVPITTMIASQPIIAKLPSPGLTIKPSIAPTIVPKPNPTPKPQPTHKQIDMKPVLKPGQVKPINIISVAFDGDDLSKKFNH